MKYFSELREDGRQKTVSLTTDTSAVAPTLKKLSIAGWTSVNIRKQLTRSNIARHDRVLFQVKLPFERSDWLLKAGRY